MLASLAMPIGLFLNQSTPANVNIAAFSLLN